MLLFLLLLFYLKIIIIKSQNHDCNFTTYYRSTLPELYEYDLNPNLIPSKTDFNAWRNITNRLILLLSSTHHVLSYSEIWDALCKVDRDVHNNTRVRLIYSNTTLPCNPHGDNDNWNREHIWPKSFGIGDSSSLSNIDYADLHNLTPAQAGVNSARGNKPYDYCYNSTASTPSPYECKQPAVNTAKSRTPYDTGSNIGGLPRWMPPEAVRGNLARSHFYMALRYNGSDTDGIINGVDNNQQNTEQMVLSQCACKKYATAGNLTSLLSWHINDNVDNLEKKRNNESCYLFQHNRNPFVDFPWLSIMFDVEPMLTEIRTDCPENWTHPDEGVCDPAPSPTSKPSSEPSSKPSSEPTLLPSSEPSSEPTNPTSLPTVEPSFNPTSSPTFNPSGNPTSFPSNVPSLSPSSRPSSIDNPRTSYTFTSNQVLGDISRQEFISNNQYSLDFLNIVARALRISRDSLYDNTLTVRDTTTNGRTSNLLRKLQSSTNEIQLSYTFLVVLGAGNPYTNKDEAFVGLTNNLVLSTSETCYENCFQNLMNDTTLGIEQSPEVIPAIFGDLQVNGVSPNEDAPNQDLLLVGVSIGIFLLLTSCYSFYFCVQKEGKEDIDDNRTISVDSQSTLNSKGQRRMTHVSTNNLGKTVSTKSIMIHDGPIPINNPLHNQNSNQSNQRQSRIVSASLNSNSYIVSRSSELSNLANNKRYKEKYNNNNNNNNNNRQ